MTSNCSSTQMIDPITNTCQCLFVYTGNNCDIYWFNVTSFNALYYIHLFLFDALFLFTFVWTLAALIEGIRNKINYFSILSISFIAIGVLLRLASSVDYFGYRGIYSERFSLFLYYEAFVFLSLAWIFMLGMWADLINSSLDGYGKTPLIVIIGGTTCFALFQTFTLLRFAFVNEAIYSILIDGLLGLGLFTVLLSPLILGSMLLKKLKRVNPVVGVTRKRQKLIKNTKFLMRFSFLLIALVILLGIYVTLNQILNILNLFELFIFQVTFRIAEVVSLCMTLMVSTGHTFVKTFKFKKRIPEIYSNKVNRI